MPARPVVAIINTSEDIVTMLSLFFASEGFQPVAGFVADFRAGRPTLAAFLEEHNPAVILWDIGLPYASNWAYFQEASAHSVVTGHQFVLTTTNKRALEALVGPTATHALLGKPYELDEVLVAVQQAAATARTQRRVPRPPD